VCEWHPGAVISGGGADIFGAGDVISGAGAGISGAGAGILGAGAGISGVGAAIPGAGAAILLAAGVIWGWRPSVPPSAAIELRSRISGDHAEIRAAGRTNRP